MTATGIEPRTTYFVMEHSTIWPNWPNDWAVFWVLTCTVQLIILVSLTKWLSVPWRTKWFWVRVQLQSLAFFSYTIMTYLKKLNGKSLNKKQCTPGLSPRIIPGYLPFYQNVLFFDMLLCCTHQVWNVSPSPKPSRKTMRIGRNPTQQPKIYSFPTPEKSPLNRFTSSAIKSIIPSL